MYVNFKTLRFKNFLTYGNSWTKIDFNNKLNIISAGNGRGKSSIVDAISFVLFGKAYRDLSIKRLINYVNKKQMEVEIEFSVGKDDYKILRGLAPKKFEMTKNGETVDLLSSKKLNQIEIDRIIGVKYLLFKNVMCIGAISNVPFFSMSLPDRRELLETIFGLESLADMLDEVKLRNSNNKIELKTITATKSGLENNIRDVESFISALNEKKKKFNENQESRIERIQDHIHETETLVKNCEYNIGKCKEKLEELSKKFDQLEMEELRKKYEVIQQELAINLSKFDELGSKLDNRDNVVCPICGADLTGEEAVKHFERIAEERAALLEERNAKISEKDSLYSQYTAQKSAREFYDKVKSRLEQEERSMGGYVSTIEYDQKQILEITNETDDFDTSGETEKLERYRSQLALSNSRLDELSDKVAIDTDLQAILSDGGIKRYFFEQIVPVLNEKLNDYIKKFGLNVDVIFNDMLEYTINRGSFDLEYNNLSNGEKTRVNVAMLLTFYDIAKQLSNWSCSILFMDEIFDTGIDSEGISSFVEEIVKMLGADKKLGVYLISHKINELNLNNIDYETMRITKSGMFSKIFTKDVR